MFHLYMHQIMKEVHTGAAPLLPSFNFKRYKRIIQANCKIYAPIIRFLTQGYKREGVSYILQNGNSQYCGREIVKILGRLQRLKVIKNSGSIKYDLRIINLHSSKEVIKVLCYHHGCPMFCCPCHLPCPIKIPSMPFENIQVSGYYGLLDSKEADILQCLFG